MNDPTAPSRAGAPAEESPDPIAALRAGDEVLHALSEDECWTLLERAALGRIAVSVRGMLDVFPVNYVADRRRIVFTTSEGTKLAALTVHDAVAFEIDGTDEQTAWSVVVKGRAHAVEALDEQLAAERLPIVSWLPTVKSRVVAIEPDAVTGRGFLRAGRPDADWY